MSGVSSTPSDLSCLSSCGQRERAAGASQRTAERGAPGNRLGSPACSCQEGTLGRTNWVKRKHTFPSPTRYCELTVSKHVGVCISRLCKMLDEQLRIFSEEAGTLKRQLAGFSFP